MLIQIHIRDLATIEELHLHLLRGCTMITGETGAGKSIFIEAIELALGGRASQNIIRPGKDKADISLIFDIKNFPKVIERLKNLDLYEETYECIIRRVITTDGRSRCYVNGAPQTVQLVRELGELLFHIHSQHEQQVLLLAENQREMLDRYAASLPLAITVKQLAEKFRDLDQEIKSWRMKTLEREERSEFLQFQLDELQSIKLKPGEWEILQAEHHRLIHAEEIIQQVQQVSSQLAEDEQNILARLHNIRKSIESIQHLEPKTNEWIKEIQEATILLADLQSEMKNYLANADLDPEKLLHLEERVSQIFSLARKHKINAEDLVAFKEQLLSELNRLHASAHEIEQLENEQKKVAALYTECAAKLSSARRGAAFALAKEITATIRSLSLPHGEFKIELEKEHTALSLHGNEKIIFHIKTNPDQPLMPLHKNISGGELSRLSLAAHLALSHHTNIPTLVFDEVDTGLSGATAEKIGKLLRKLGNSYQVFCITHQAQVAAHGEQHLLVEKYFVAKTTHSSMRLLETKEKTQEIARMLGGEKITEKTLEHAQEMLQATK